MEQEIFEYDGFDEVNIMSFLFYNITFKKKFGSINKGTKCDSVYLDYEKGIIELYNNDDPEPIKSLRFKLIPRED